MGRTRISWMKTIQQDLKSSDLNMDDTVNLAQNHPLWRLMSTFGATHSQWCLPEMMMMPQQILMPIAVYQLAVCAAGIEAGDGVCNSP